MTFIQIFTLGYRSNYLIAGLIVGLIIATYSFFRLSRLFNHFNISKKNSLIFRVVSSFIIFLCCFNIQSTATLLLSYLFLSSFLADLIRIVYELLFKKRNFPILNKIPKIHQKGILALVIFLLVISISVYGMAHVDCTTYNLTTDKTNNSYSILYISDVHYNTIQDPNLLSNKIIEMNNLNPDIVILGGDIVDERTDKNSMKEVFSTLSKINSTYGTFFIYGNHDKQPNVNDYINQTKPFNNSDLEKAIKDNGIEILEDENVIINQDIVLIGRSDASWNDSYDRLNSSTLLQGVNLSNYVVILDHQPLEAKENSRLGVDLQLSGHTHGGQIFPYGLASNIIGKLNYGEYKINDMIQIVSSGYAGWGMPLRNEAKCEYVFIDIN